MNDPILDTHDIQGLVLRGFGKLPCARFLVLEITNLDHARSYLRAACERDRVNRANVSADTGLQVTLQIAFTARGLEELGLPESTMVTFSREFREGMDDELRGVALGDRRTREESCTWQWGSRAEPIHVLVMVYAAGEAVLEAQLERERALLAAGFRIRHEKSTTPIADDQKEHFGWRDGISMPIIAGVPKRDQSNPRAQESWTGAIAPGEFVLGYRNDYGAFTESPTVDPDDDAGNLLPAALEAPGKKSLGRNGTYLVFREMTQHVHEMWDYLAAQSREPGADAAARAIALGAKMVGRWPSGAPLVEAPEADNPKRATANTFTYGKDLDGLACPHGAHIRRANPRDVLAIDDRDAEASRLMVRKHQMIRRGRPFGPRVVASLDPREILATRPDPERRGLHFICLVGSIARQFEFMQRAWINSANFDSLFKDGDPIAAARRTASDANQNDEFTCPATPVRRKYKAMPAFTTLAGGGYFFLPGLRALNFIAQDR